MNPTLTTWLQLLGLLAVEVAVIVGIAAQLQRLTRSAIWRRTIWQACILSLLLLVTFELTGAARGLAGWIGQKPAAASPIPLRIPNANSETSTLRVGPPTQTHVEFQPAATYHAIRNTQLAKAPGAIVASESLSVLWFTMVWMAGTGIVIGRALVSRTVLEIFRWQRKRIENVDLFESAQALALLLGIRRRVRLMESARIPAPVAFGILRPTIGLPPQFGVKFNSVQQEAMLAHELAHLAGNDPAWYLLADILAAALWWHPLIWWSRRQLHAQSELAADEASLLVANGPGILAECLVALGARLAQTRSFIPLGVAGTGYRSGLGRRVERLVKLEGTAWRPPDRIRCGLARILGPMALVAAAILCTAWVVPPALTKGENMQTMKQTWKKSLAAFALLTAFGSNNNPAIADTTDAQTVSKPEAVAATGTNIKASGGASGGGSVGQSSSFTTRLTRLSPAPKSSKERELVEAKLNRITLPSIKYDGLPLTEVINNLVEQSMLRDSDKQGINFVLDRETPAPGPAAVDPTTGLPLPVETVDLSTITVKIDPALKNVRLIDILEVLTKTADRPIKYSIEDYGVLISSGASKPIEAKTTEAIHEPAIQALLEPMEVMTFKLDTNTFFAGMQSMFGTQYVNDPKVIRSAVGDIFQRLGIVVNPRRGFPGFGGGGGDVGGGVNAQNKSFFYNELNGILVVRGTHQDLEAVKGVIEALGGVPYMQPGAVSSGGGGGSAGGGGAGR